MEHVSTKPDFIGLEEKILRFWKESMAFDKLRTKTRDRPLFRFVDGPITANNPMGVHHAWGRTLKDAFIRFQVLRGHRCRYQNGFDCQGLWVEVEVEKSLGFTGKENVERYGMDNFARACKQRVEQFSRKISEQSVRLGQWMDWDHSYFTHTDGNIIGIWHFLNKCHENGWIYRAGMPMPWCVRCGTSLSEHEMAGSYKATKHLSVFVHVPFLDDPSRRLLLWTTTPWTLSSNVAAAVHPDLTYCEVSSPQWDHRLIVGKGRLEVLRGIPTKVERTFKGEELLGRRYESIFPEFEAQASVECRVVAWKEVAAEEGTGIVHIAPGCGREDFELSGAENLTVIAPLDEAGRFLEGFGWLTGRHVFEVAEDVAAALGRAGKLLRSEMYEHKYPVCWRCKDDLAFRLVGEWFISCDEIRPRMMEEAAKVKWQPEFVGKRMQDWLTNMGDWCISRKRYWGLPLPFYSCDQCRHVEIVGSLDELKRLAVDPAIVDRLPELHRPWIDEVKIKCPKCGAEVPRIPEVGDCWLDAGIVPYSTLGYFQDRDAWKQAYPVEWVCEMQEQVRLWFYSMLFMGVTISGRSPYQRVLAHERVVSETGTAFSKTGFMIHFDEAVDRMGADVMRYLYCSHPVATELHFGYAGAEFAWRKLSSLWNIYVFFVTYAMIDRPDNLDSVPAQAYQLTDRWLLARTERMLQRVTRRYEDYNTPNVIQELESYVEEVSNWYVRLNRRRFWKEGDRADKQACYSALFECLKASAIAFAPITPFLSEEIWQNVIRSLQAEAPESVHHVDWPRPNEQWADADLLERTETVRNAIRLALRLREQNGLRVRQPLGRLFVVCSGAAREAIQEQAGLVQNELNVKEITLCENEGAFRSKRLALDLRAAGPALKQDLSTVRQLLEGLEPAHMARLVVRFDAGEQVELPGYDRPLPPAVFKEKEVVSPGFVAESDGEVTVALDVTITERLRREGLARDLVRRLQILRREVDLELTQRIDLGLEIQGEDLHTAVDEHRQYIKNEVLAVSLTDRALETPLASGEWTFQQSSVRATFSRH